MPRPARKPASHDRVRRTLEALQARRSANQNANATLAATLLQQPQPADQDAAAPQAGAGQPGTTAQPPADGETTQVTPANPQTAIDAARLAEAAGAILGPVDVEYVEGLDVIVLRGAQRDVERVSFNSSVLN